MTSTGEVKSSFATERIRGLQRLSPESSDDDTVVTDIELAQPDMITPDHAQTTEDMDWENEPENPQNWSAWKKTLQVVMLSSTALQAYVSHCPSSLAKINVKPTEVSARR